MKLTIHLNEPLALKGRLQWEATSSAQHAVLAHRAYVAELRAAIAVLDEEDLRTSVTGDPTSPSDAQ